MRRRPDISPWVRTMLRITCWSLVAGGIGLLLFEVNIFNILLLLLSIGLLIFFYTL